MRRSLVIFLVVFTSVIIYLLHSVSTLLSLLFEDASADAIHRSEIPSPNSSLIETRPQLIPKIIHQTYVNESVPSRWQQAQRSCIDLHPDYQYILWTDGKARHFIENEYPWFLSTFDGYAHNIQRADAIRYFVLAYHGGVYIDLDLGCERRLDPLLSYPAWVRRTIPTGVSNDVMGAVPQHPFFLRVIESLSGAKKNWVLPYITIMASTGPLFLSVIWKNWMSDHPDEEADWPGRVRILMADDYNQHPWSFFHTYVGSSWHGKDARLIFWMARNWMLITVVGFVVGLSAVFTIWMIYNKLVALSPWSSSKKRRPPRISVERIGGPGTPGGSKKRVASPLSDIWFRLRRGGSVRRPKQSYELVEQHDA